MVEKHSEHVADAVARIHEEELVRGRKGTIVVFEVKNQWGPQAPHASLLPYFRELYPSPWVKTIPREHAVALNIGRTLDEIKDEITRSLQRIEATIALREVVRSSLLDLHTETTKVRRDLAKLTQEHRKLQEQVTSLLEEIEDRPIVSQTWLRDLNCDTYRLKTPIPVTVEQYPDEVTARWPEAETFGAGATETQALADLKNEIVDLFEDIELLERTEPDRLGKPLQSVARLLGDTIEKLNG